eukprot:SAG25_NODE_1437_length_3023_cov_2.829343_5_plen_176_part_00
MEATGLPSGIVTCCRQCGGAGECPRRYSEKERKRQARRARRRARQVRRGVFIVPALDDLPPPFTGKGIRDPERPWDICTACKGAGVVEMEVGSAVGAEIPLAVAAGVDFGPCSSLPLIAIIGGGYRRCCPGVGSATSWDACRSVRARHELRSEETGLRPHHAAGWNSAGKTGPRT